ncbi:MAG: hypothetical protein ACJA13_004069 [Paraglaciecola sp.]
MSSFILCAAVIPKRHHGQVNPANIRTTYHNNFCKTPEQSPEPNNEAGKVFFPKCDPEKIIGLPAHPFLGSTDLG